MRTDFVLDALEQLCTLGNRSATGAWSVTPIGDLSTSAFSTQSGWPKPASSHLWAARATDSYDNDLPETVDGLYKAELIQRRAPWRTKEAVKLATLEWVSWFNHHRLLEPIGYLPPVEANSYRQLAKQDTAVVT